jgi:hypothetical protein
MPSSPMGDMPEATATVGHFRVYRDPDPHPDGGPVSWVVEDTRDGVAMSDWFTYADAITEAVELDKAERKATNLEGDQDA